MLYCQISHIALSVTAQMDLAHLTDLTKEELLWDQFCYWNQRITEKYGCGFADGLLAQFKDSPNIMQSQIKAWQIFFLRYNIVEKSNLKMKNASWSISANSPTQPEKLHVEQTERGLPPLTITRERVSDDVMKEWLKKIGKV